VILSFAERSYGNLLKFWCCFLWALYLSSTRELQDCVFSRLCMCSVLHGEPVDASLQTPFAYGAAISSFTICTEVSWSCVPALIPVDFTVTCHFKRTLLIDIYWWLVVNFLLSRAWGLSYASSPLCSVPHKYVVNGRYCHRELKSA